MHERPVIEQLQRMDERLAVIRTALGVLAVLLAALLWCLFVLLRDSP
jgi:hypothetical protein